jgi:hypothetical protein
VVPALGIAGSLVLAAAVKAVSLACVARCRIE